MTSLDTSLFMGCNIDPNQTARHAPRLTPEWLAGDLTWFSGATQQERTARRTP